MVYIMKNGEFSVIFLNKLYNVECLFLFLCLVFIHFFFFFCFLSDMAQSCAVRYKTEVELARFFTSSVQLKIT